MAVSKPKRIRQEFADWQKEILENFFQLNWEFTTDDYIALGLEIKEKPIRVKHWLNNRRHKAKVTGEREGVRAWKDRPVGQPKPKVQLINTRKYQRKTKANSNQVGGSPSNAFEPYELSIDVAREECDTPLSLTISITVPPEVFTEECQATKRRRDESLDENSSKKFKAAGNDANIEAEETDTAKILGEFGNYIPDDASSLTIPATPDIFTSEDDDERSKNQFGAADCDNNTEVQEVDIAKILGELDSYVPEDTSTTPAITASEGNKDDGQFDIGEFLVFNEPASPPHQVISAVSVSDEDDFSVHNYQEYFCVPDYQDLPTRNYHPANYYQQPVAHYLQYSGSQTQDYYTANCYQYPVAYQPQYPVQNQTFYYPGHMNGEGANNMWYYQ